MEHIDSSRGMGFMRPWNMAEQKEHLRNCGQIYATALTCIFLAHISPRTREVRYVRGVCNL